MKLESIAKGCWSFQVVDPTDGTSINVRVHARDADGQPCHEPNPALIAAAEEVARNATKLRDEFVEALGFPERETVIEMAADRQLHTPGFTREELLHPTDDTLLRLRQSTRLLYLQIAEFSSGFIETCGWVVDAWSRVWEVGDDYVEGWFQLGEFPD